MLTKITVSGGFHNAAPIKLVLKNGTMSLRQYRKLKAHMCGIPHCICAWRGFELYGIGREAFVEIVENITCEAESMKI